MHVFIYNEYLTYLFNIETVSVNRVFAIRSALYQVGYRHIYLLAFKLGVVFPFFLSKTIRRKKIFTLLL